MKTNIFFLILLISLKINAQILENKSLKSFIEVTGTAQKEVVPDIIYTSIILSEKSNGNKKYTIPEQETALFAILKKINVDQKNIRLADLNSEITTYKRKETGFEQKKEYSVKLTSAEQISKLFDELWNANIKEATISGLEHSRIEEYRKEVRISALQAAKAKAEYLLVSIGEELDKPLEIIENTNSRAYLSKSNVVLREDSSYENVEFRKIKISFSYQVKFGIK